MKTTSRTMMIQCAALAQCAQINATTPASVLRIPRAWAGSAVVLALFTATLVAPRADAQTIADSPLYMTFSIKPNIMLAVDDSGSMDSEVLLPTNDGALWWHATHRSFVGLNANDASLAGTINYNRAGQANSTWKKYVYLFPNGTGTGNRLYADSTNDHFAVPPRPEYAFLRSFEYNKAYYDASKTYAPWPSTYGTTFNDANPAAARSDPARGSATFNLIQDLSSSSGDWTFKLWPGMRDASGAVVAAETNGTFTYYPATYYTVTSDNLGYDGTRNCASPHPADYTAFEANPAMTLPTGVHAIGPDGKCLTRYEIRSSVTTYPSGRTYAEEIQNFANWFTYYRKRHLAMRGGTLTAFDSISGVRTGLYRFNSRPNPVTMLDFDSQRGDFYNTLKNFVSSGGTPTRASLKHAGDQYMLTGAGAPITNSCQKNFTIVFTDGFANVSNEGVGNVDGSKGSPYADTFSNTLGDIAMKYYSENLRPDLESGTVLPPPRCSQPNPPAWLDCNKNPHMVTYAVTLGTRGQLFGVSHHSVADAYANPPTWQDPSTERHPAQVDDLYHAALNGRGDMFNATSADEIGDMMTEVLKSIVAKQSSAAALATNSTRLSTDTVVFQAKFDSTDWSGRLVALPVEAAGSIGSQLWDAAEQIPAHAARNIFTWSGTAGIAFDWASLSATQKTAIDSANAANTSSPVLNYLRGDQSGEQKNGGGYRDRSVVMGDIINSDPYFSGVQNFGYAALPGTEGSGYLSFVGGKENRTKMLYVGANAGMLHALRATDGVELFAYVPDAVVPNLHLLASPSYTHKYYVDGSPIVGDAYFARPTVDTTLAWRSVLLGTTGAGGRSVFALDVTNPDSFDASKVLWEFTHPELGHTIGQPIIARLNNGKWAAIFGNGYGSTSGTAKLFVVYLDANISDNSWDLNTDYLVFDTNSTTASGLATPALYDSNGDFIHDYVYAGDMQGNLWKFNFSNANPAQWEIANKQGSTYKPLFTARNASNQAQSITSPLEIGAPPSGQSGVMIYFGTGRFFMVGDDLNTQVQSFYGILDDFANNNDISYTCSGGSCNRTSILGQQTIVYEGNDPGNAVHGRSAADKKVRVVSQNSVSYSGGSAKRGWYLDLVPPSGTATGERVVSVPLLRFGRVIFTTLIPSSDPCKFGGNSWLMELNATTGGRLDYSVFDLDDNDLFNATDYVTVTVGGQTITVPVSSILSEVGIIKTPTVISAGEVEYKLASGTSGTIGVTKEKGGELSSGRVSWRELINE